MFAAALILACPPFEKVPSWRAPFLRCLLSVTGEVAPRSTSCVNPTYTRFTSFKACWSASRYWRWSGWASA